MTHNILYLAVILTTLTCGCSSNLTPPDLTLPKVAPATLNIREVTVRPYQDKPEDVFSGRAAMMLTDLIKRSLYTKGLTSQCVVTIQDATVTETDLKPTGAERLLNIAPTFRYDFNFDIMLEIFDDKGFRRGYATSRVHKYITGPAGQSLNERDTKLAVEVRDGLKALYERLIANTNRAMPMLISTF